jgi:hypothetical protein
MVVIGDTEGHDKLCGRYNSHTLQVQHVCHHCNIPTMGCDDAFYPWWHVLPGGVQALVKAEDDHVGLKAIFRASSSVLGRILNARLPVKS